MKLKLLIYILIMSCTFGCDAEQDIIPVQTESLHSISFDVSVQVEAITRADAKLTSKTNFNTTEDRVGVYALRTTVNNDGVSTPNWATSTLAPTANNTPFKFKEEDRTLNMVQVADESELKLMGSDNTGYYFYAYYPYNSEVQLDEYKHTPKIPISIDSDISNQTDYLYVVEPHKMSSDNVSLRFIHALSRLQFVFDPGKNDYDTDRCPYIKNIRITTSYGQKGYMIFENDRVGYEIPYDSDGKKNFVYTLSTPLPVLPAHKGQPVGDFVFIPDMASDIQIKENVGNVIKEIFLTGTDEDGQEFTLPLFQKSKTKRMRPMYPNERYTIKVEYNSRTDIRVLEDNRGVVAWESDSDLNIDIDYNEI